MRRESGGRRFSSLERDFRFGRIEENLFDSEFCGVEMVGEVVDDEEQKRLLLLLIMKDLNTASKSLLVLENSNRNGGLQPFNIVS